MERRYENTTWSVEPFDSNSQSTLMIRHRFKNTAGFILRITRRKLGEPTTTYRPTAYIDGHAVRGASKKTLLSALNWVFNQRGSHES